MPSFPIITLTSDWNNADFYAGAVKGAIFSKFPECHIVDISHQISPFNVFEAAFILRNACSYFPNGTIHLVGVKNLNNLQNHLLIKHNQQFFITADNGLFSLMFEDMPEKIIALPEYRGVFVELELYVDAAVSILKNKKIEELGKIMDSCNAQSLLRATIDEALIIGNILHIDSYQNVITNISKDLFERVGKGRKFEITIQSTRNKISKISKSYCDVDEGELLALFNTVNLLEIALKDGNLAELLGLNINSIVRVNFLNT
jgi:S-adenosyl-L-methionine hydrolase (adenosine-forming)